MILDSTNLQKSFKNRKVLKGVDFKINEGEVCAILGKNGAGKSTFIKIALGLVSLTDGNITIYGDRPGIHNSRIGYLSENITIYPHLSARDNLKVAAYSSNQKISDKNIATILKRVNLEDTRNKPVKSFSLGMKRRLQLAMATMIKKVDFLILDEPTNGLDINGLIWLKNYIDELRKSGVSILLASHAISDLQDCITDYVILHEGRITKIGNWLKERNQSTGFKIKVSPDDYDAAMLALKSYVCNLNASISEDKSDAVVSEAENEIFIETDKSYKEICEYLYHKGIFPENVCEKKKSLEAIFLETVKENGA